MGGLHSSTDGQSKSKAIGSEDRPPIGASGTMAVRCPQAFSSWNKPRESQASCPQCFLKCSAVLLHAGFSCLL